MKYDVFVVNFIIDFFRTIIISFAAVYDIYNLHWDLCCFSSKLNHLCFLSLLTFYFAVWRYMYCLLSLVFLLSSLWFRLFFGAPSDTFCSLNWSYLTVFIQKFTSKSKFILTNFFPVNTVFLKRAHFYSVFPMLHAASECMVIYRLYQPQRKRWIIKYRLRTGYWLRDRPYGLE